MNRRPRLPTQHSLVVVLPAVGRLSAGAATLWRHVHARGAARVPLERPVVAAPPLHDTRATALRLGVEHVEHIHRAHLQERVVRGCGGEGWGGGRRQGAERRAGEAMLRRWTVRGRHGNVRTSTAYKRRASVVGTQWRRVRAGEHAAGAP